MKLHADFAKRVALHTDQIEWQPSPIPGVDRRMLDRVGDEVARATSIVRYAPNSRFAPHVHPGGEEFIVLQGVFQDEHGDYPANSYVRNPPHSEHTPGSQQGCIIFVKLWQFDPADRTHIHKRCDSVRAVADATRPGVSVIPLFQDHRENVRIERWKPDAELTIDAAGGGEILVLEGSFKETGEHFRTHSWLRLPTQSLTSVTAGPEGARVWIKTGHLRFVDELPPALVNKRISE